MTAERATRIVRVSAFAKINLTLRVLGTRVDGYHELQTRFQSIDLHDTLTFLDTPGAAFRIECDDPQCPLDDTNLVWRAAEQMWRLRGRRSRLTGLTVRIEKRIPVRAGLGGGSTDAAAAIRALAALWRIRAGVSRLGRIAADIGADVPFFRDGGTTLGTGRGDVLTRMKDEPRAWVVLVIPGFGVSTVDAYRWWDAEGISGATARSEREIQNDLEGPVARRHPQIARIVEDIGRAGAFQAAMSGSGSAVFGLFTTRARAQSGAASMIARSYETIVTRTIDRETYKAKSRPTVVRPDL